MYFRLSLFGAAVASCPKVVSTEGIIEGLLRGNVGNFAQQAPGISETPLADIADPDFPRSKRKLEDSCEGGSYDIDENTVFTYQQGLGESPGIPGIGFLGIGYNIIAGNPRGDILSELDPGFGQRVVALEQNQGALTTTQAFMKPLGTEVLDAKTCTFSSSAEELYTTKQLQSQLSQEASSSKSKGFNVGGGGGGSRGGTGGQALASYSQKKQFSKSKKVEQFSQQTVKEQVVSYEAKAMCTVREAFFKNYYAKTLDTTFEDAVAALPSTYSDDNREVFEEFVRSFGTHYVTKILLGAKHVLTTKIRSRDVLDLQKNSVDVRKTMSFDASWEASIEASSKPVPSPSPTDIVVRVYDGDAPAATPAPEPPETSANGSLSGGESKSKSRSSGRLSQSESLDEVKQRVTTVEEVNVGGIPAVDGNVRTWAQSVAENPMPVSYELEGLWEFMTEGQTRAFYLALQDIYGIDFQEADINDRLLKAFHFGASDGTGTPITSYVDSPLSSYRTELQFSTELGTSNSDLSVSEFDIYRETTNPCTNKHTLDFRSWVRGSNAKDYLCGFRISVDVKDGGGDDMGIFHMQAYFCNLDTWSDKERKELYKYSGSEPSGSGVELDIDKMCPENLFVVGAQVQASRRQDGENDPRGLVGLRFWCNSIERQKERIDPQEIEAKWFNDNQNLFDTGLISNPDIDSSYISGASTQNGIADFDNGAGCTEDKGATGVIGLKFETTEVILGATYDIFGYQVLWEDAQGDPLPVFAHPIIGDVAWNNVEDYRQSGMYDYSGNSKTENLFRLASFAVLGVDDPTARFGFYDFESNQIQSRVQSFTYLVGDNLNDPAYRSGVVHPHGYALSKSFQSENSFTIQKYGFDGSDDDGDRLYNSVKVNFDVPFQETPTVLAYPVWLLGSNTFPEHLGDVSVAVMEAGQESFRVAVGSSNLAPVQGLAFAFIAIDGTITSPYDQDEVEPNNSVDGVIHGRIVMEKGNEYPATQCDNANMDVFGAGFTAENCYASSPSLIGGIEIFFDFEFDGIPSLAVTPVLDDGMAIQGVASGSPFSGSYPAIRVNRVTESSAFIEAIWWDGDSGTYTPMSFNFMVVGPPVEGEPTPVSGLEPADAETPEPTPLPSAVPSSAPSQVPSKEPSSTPSQFPSEQPSSKPSTTPSSIPSSNPSTTPSSIPSSNPSAAYCMDYVGEDECDEPSNKGTPRIPICISKDDGTKYETKCKTTTSVVELIDDPPKKESFEHCGCCTTAEEGDDRPDYCGVGTTII